jgi:hypothetical protein
VGQEPLWTGVRVGSAVRYGETGTPGTQYCHCDLCRRATGALLAVLAGMSSRVLEYGRRTRLQKVSPIAQRGDLFGLRVATEAAYVLRPMRSHSGRKIR